MTTMLRSFVWLWIGAVCSVAVGAQVIAVDPATATAITPSVVNCESPTDLNRVSASNSEAALLAEMEAWWRQREAMQKKALSHMEAWWRERSEQRAPVASTTAPPTASDARAQVEVWWRQRGERELTDDPLRALDASERILQREIRRLRSRSR